MLDVSLALKTRIAVVTGKDGEGNKAQHFGLLRWPEMHFNQAVGSLFAGNLKEFTADLSSSLFASVHVKGF